MILNKLLKKKQVAQWATIAHLGASLMFGDTIKAGNSKLDTVIRNKFKHSRYYVSSGYMQVLKMKNECARIVKTL